MATSAAKITYATERPRALFRVAGRAAAERARDFDEAVRRLVADGVREVFLDLRECPLLDSTFSGTVAGLAEGRNGTGPLVQFVLVGAKPRILDGLANLEVLPLLRVWEDAEPVPFTVPLEELAPSQSGHREMGLFCLQAHRALGRLSEANRERFRELESMLQAELSRNETAGPGR
jgi:anti-anti-sigma regulatory factor